MDTKSDLHKLSSTMISNEEKLIQEIVNNILSYDEKVITEVIKRVSKFQVLNCNRCRIARANHCDFSHVISHQLKK